MGRAGGETGVTRRSVLLVSGMGVFLASVAGAVASVRRSAGPAAAPAASAPTARPSTLRTPSAATPAAAAPARRLGVPTRGRISVLEMEPPGASEGPATPRGGGSRGLRRAPDPSGPLFRRNLAPPLRANGEAVRRPMSVPSARMAGAPHGAADETAPGLHGSGASSPALVLGGGGGSRAAAAESSGAARAATAGGAEPEPAAMGGAGAGDVAAPSPAAGAAPPAANPAPGPPAPITPPPDGEFSRDLALTFDPRVQLLAERVSFGPTPAWVAEIEALGPEAFLERQLDPESIDDRVVEAVLTAFPGLGLDNRTRRESMNDQEAIAELRHATLLRALLSRRQLFEVMVDFWTNHLNVDIQKGDCAYFKTSDDRDVVRRHAHGRFTDLLKASAQSPAMLLYLDNDKNRGANPNENYGREVMELHTVGVEAGYTESDVRNAALVLSGWRVRDGEFAFEESEHHRGPIQVMGFFTPGVSGLADGLAFLDYLARHPSTARRIARKLCQRFVADEAPAELVDALAATYLAHDTAIAPVLRALFASDAFWASGQAKLRRPFEWLTAMLRALAARVEVPTDSSSARNLARVLEGLGQPLFGFPPPTGYPDVAAAWLSADGMLQRWTLAGAAGADRLSGVEAAIHELVPGPPAATVGEWIAVVAARLFPRPLPAAQWEALVAFLGVPAGETLTASFAESRLPRLVGMLLASPLMQLH